MYTYTCIHAYTYISIHTHTHTHTHTWIHIHIHMHIHVHIHIYIYICLCKYVYISTSIAYAHPVEREANVYADVHNICLTYTPAHAWCATTPVHACRLSAKNAYGLVYARLFNCAAASLPCKLLRTYLESCANIVQAVVYCPPFRPPSCRQSVARRCSLKKSVQIHASS